jgi:hypothetical protein
MINIFLHNSNVSAETVDHNIGNVDIFWLTDYGRICQPISWGKPQTAKDPNSGLGFIGLVIDQDNYNHTPGSVDIADCYNPPPGYLLMDDFMSRGITMMVDNKTTQKSAAWFENMGYGTDDPNDILVEQTVWTVKGCNWAILQWKLNNQKASPITGVSIGLELPISQVGTEFGLGGSSNDGGDDIDGFDASSGVYWAQDTIGNGAGTTIGFGSVFVSEPITHYHANDYHAEYQNPNNPNNPDPKYHRNFYSNETWLYERLHAPNSTASDGFTPGNITATVGWNDFTIPAVSFKTVIMVIAVNESYDSMITAVEEARYYYLHVATGYRITEFSDADSAIQRVEIFNLGRPETDLSEFSIFANWGQLIGTWSSPSIPTYGHAVFQITGGTIGPEGDTIYLYHSVGGLMDVVSYGQEGTAPDPLTGESVARQLIIEYTDSWLRNATLGPTWGYENDVGVEGYPHYEVVLNRVMFNPIEPEEAYVELVFLGYGRISTDISGFRIVCDDEFIIPSGITLDMDNRFYVLTYSDSPTFFSNMDASGDNIYFYDTRGNIQDMVGWSSSHEQGQYMSRYPDGWGGRLGFNDVTSQAAKWIFDELPSIQITEFYVDSVSAQIEIYNPRGGDKVLDSRWMLTVDSGILTGTFSPPTIPKNGGYSVFTMSSGTPGTEGDTIKIYYDLGSGPILMDEISFGTKGLAPDPLIGESTARYWIDTPPEYNNNWTRENNPTFGFQNNVPHTNYTNPAVLNEIMFNPFAPEHGFIELYINSIKLDISGYKIVCDSVYTIPSGTQLTFDEPYFYLSQSDDPSFFSAINPSGDNVYLYDNNGCPLDMAGWSSPHIQGKTMSRVPNGNGTRHGFDDISSMTAGWVFGCTPTVLLVQVNSSEYVKYGLINDVLYFNLTITNKQNVNDIFQIFNSTINGYQVVILDETRTFIISEVFILAKAYLNITVMVILPSSTPCPGRDNITITIQSTTMYMIFKSFLLYAFVRRPPVANAGEDQIKNEGETFFFDGSGSYDPDYDWHKLDVNFATDSALYLRIGLPQGPVDGAWEGGVQEWVNFSSPRPFWICKKAGHLGQGPTGFEYIYYWKMHETGYFTLNFGAANGNYYADVFDETNGTYIISGIYVQSSVSQDIIRLLIKTHVYRLDIYNTTSFTPNFPNDLDVNFVIEETEILMTPNRDSLVYFVNQDPLDLAIEGPGVTQITFYSRSIQEFYAYYAFKLDHSEAEVGGGELSMAEPPYNLGITPSEFNDTILNISDELNYIWDFDANYDSDGDGNKTNDIDASVPNPIHTYGDDGVYIVTLTVTEFHGLSDTDICNITVNNLPPVIEPFGPFSVTKGILLNINGIATDPGSDDLKFTWSWGDGAPNSISVYYNDGIGPDPYPSPQGTFPFSKIDTKLHAYDDNGVYYLNLTVEDDDGGVSIHSTTVTVNEITIKPPILFINVSQDGKDVALNWDPPPILGIEYYLIYRSKHQTEFDFNTVWVNTSKNKEPGESDPIPLRTIWNDTNAAYPKNETNYEEQYYYTIRVVNSFGMVSRTSRTVGKWTKTFSKGVSTFSLPLEPLSTLSIDDCLINMNAEYIKWMDPQTHIWMKHGDGHVNDAQMRLGEGYEVKFNIQTDYTFTGMPGAMISYGDQGGFSGFDHVSEAKDITVSIEVNGDIILSWQKPVSMGIGDYYEIYYSYKRDGFFGTPDEDYHPACSPVPYETNTKTITGLGANNPNARLFIMIIPFDADGVRGASSYSIGIWTEELLSQYDTFGIPLKMSNSQTADWYCDNIPFTVGINYFNHNKQRWGWHSTRMPSGAYDPLLLMTEGYQISTSCTTKFTFIGV